MNKINSLILIRGGGDLASGVALRLYRVGLNLLITEKSQPLAVRRMVSFAEAVYSGHVAVEGVNAYRVDDLGEIESVLAQGDIPIMVDPACEKVLAPHSPIAAPLAIIDARMTKRTSLLSMDAAPLVIGLGPGFVAGENCHAAIETNRGHFLGRVIWDGAPEPDTGIPEAVAKHQSDRVLRAPSDGIIKTRVEIGSRVQAGQVVAEVSGKKIIAPFSGILRGLLHDGLQVQRGLKVGDLDPRNDPRFAVWVSEKSLAIGGGVLEALLTNPEIRKCIWN